MLEAVKERFVCASVRWPLQLVVSSCTERADKACRELGIFFCGLASAVGEIESPNYIKNVSISTID